MALFGRKTSSPERAHQRGPLTVDTPLLCFGEVVTDANDGPLVNPWTLRDAFEGTQIFGETGSGKTSGSGFMIASAFLRYGLGGLVLTAKSSDMTDWIGVRDEAGRLVKEGFFHQAGRGDPVLGKDYLVLGEGSDLSFNFLETERARLRGLTHNVVSLFLTAVEGGGDRDSHEDAYWTDALRQLLTNAIDLVVLATDELTLQDIQEVIQTAPQSRDEARSVRWQRDNELCWRYLNLAQANVAGKISRARLSGNTTELRHWIGRRRDLNQTVSYWLLDFAGLADRTRSVIVSSFTSKSTGLTRSPLQEILCSKKSFDLVKATRDGIVVFLNWPVKRYAELGRFAQVLVKTVWQRGIEHSQNQSKPVFLWADEAQFFVTKEDMLFQTTARSAGCATVYLTQNVSNYYAVMNGRNGSAATDSLLGNLTTKIFHANGDPATNDWAQRLFGNDIKERQGTSEQDFSADVTRSKNPSMEPVVLAREFSALLKGGDHADRLIFEAIIFQGGRVWSGGAIEYLMTRFERART